MQVDTAGRRLTFDVIQFLSGKAAADAYRRDNPGDSEGPPNDYYIVNSNTKLRTAPVAPGAVVALVKLGQTSNSDLKPATFDELPAYLASATPPGQTRSSVPFWLTLKGAKVVRIEEQYVP